MPAEKKNAVIEVFRVGTFTPIGGMPVSFSADDLQSVAQNYDGEKSPAPIVVGHPKTDDPAFGWADNFSFNEGTGILSASLTDIEPSFADAVGKGQYKKVSLSFFAPNSSANPKPGSFYPKHIGFLGAMPPAVSGLTPVSFADHADADILMFEGSMDFGSFDAENVGSIFRGIRDWMIETIGKEKADEIIPSWRIDWVNDLALDTNDDPAGFADGSLTIPKDTKKETPMSIKDTANFAAREAKVSEREELLDARDLEDRKASNLLFAESLIEGEKLVPASKADLVALLNSAGEAEQTVSFAADSNPVDLVAGIKSILERQPKIINFGSTDLGADPEDGKVVNFAAPDGVKVDTSEMAIHQRALAHQSAHPGTTYLAAVQAVGG